MNAADKKASDSWLLNALRAVDIKNPHDYVNSWTATMTDVKSTPEYNLELQAQLDKNIGDPLERLRRAEWIIEVISRALVGGNHRITEHAAWKTLAARLQTVFGKDIPIKRTTHGLLAERKTWVAVEFDELVVGVNTGYRVGFDEFSEIYGTHGMRLGIELIKGFRGILFQNTNQITTDKYFDKFCEFALMYGMTYHVSPSIR